MQRFDDRHDRTGSRRLTVDHNDEVVRRGPVCPDVNPLDTNQVVKE